MITVTGYPKAADMSGTWEYSKSDDPSNTRYLRLRDLQSRWWEDPPEVFAVKMARNRAWVFRSKYWVKMYYEVTL